jgi:hypothetical protein
MAPAFCRHPDFSSHRCEPPWLMDRNDAGLWKRSTSPFAPFQPSVGWTMSEESISLYQKRIQIYPRSVKGRFRNLKTGILVLAYVVYYLLPWLRWERPNAPNQAILYDLPGRHFYIFDLVIQVQDIFWLAGVLIIFAILLFFVTGIAGRVWCGYFCFQTLWTDLFMMVEQWVQGERRRGCGWTRDRGTVKSW